MRARSAETAFELVKEKGKFGRLAFVGRSVVRQHAIASSQGKAFGRGAAVYHTNVLELRTLRWRKCQAVQGR